MSSLQPSANAHARTHYTLLGIVVLCSDSFAIALSSNARARWRAALFAVARSLALLVGTRVNTLVDAVQLAACMDVCSTADPHKFTNVNSGRLLVAACCAVVTDANC